MIEKLIDLYYTDEWEEIAPQGIYPLLCKCLQEARSCIPPTLWELLHKSWFHDTYVLELTCTQRQASGASHNREGSGRAQQGCPGILRRFAFPSQRQYC